MTNQWINQDLFQPATWSNIVKKKLIKISMVDPCLTILSLSICIYPIYFCRIKFGLYEVDFSHPNRTRVPRQSARVYTEIIKSRTIGTSPVQVPDNFVELN